MLPAVFFCFSKNILLKASASMIVSARKTVSIDISISYQPISMWVCCLRHSFLWVRAQSGSCQESYFYKARSLLLIWLVPLLTHVCVPEAFHGKVKINGELFDSRNWCRGLLMISLRCQHQCQDQNPNLRLLGLCTKDCHVNWQHISFNKNFKKRFCNANTPFTFLAQKLNLIAWKFPQWIV